MRDETIHISCDDKADDALRHRIDIFLDRRVVCFQQVAGSRQEACPQHRARDGKTQEGQKRHPANACRHGDQGADGRDEAPEEDCLLAVLLEHLQCMVELVRGNREPPTVAVGQESDDGGDEDQAEREEEREREGPAADRLMPSLAAPLPAVSLAPVRKHSSRQINPGFSLSIKYPLQLRCHVL